MTEHTPYKRTAIIIVAAGTGTRCGGNMPKQYMSLGGRSVLQTTLDNIRAAMDDITIVVVIRSDHAPMLTSCCSLDDSILIVQGGQTRQESVGAGLAAIQDIAPDYVLIHDAARPFISPVVCTELLAELAWHKAVVPVLPVADTLKHINNGRIICTIDRTDTYHVQTPQAFHYQLLCELHEQHTQHVTDDAALCEAAGIDIATVAGSPCLFKITTAEDLAMAQALYASQCDICIGHGYDVHQLLPYETSVASNMIRLGGIDIAHNHYLKGHSDADVVLHALTDAILGAVGEGDIGQHFPPSNDSFANMDSSHFVRHALQLCHDHGGCLVNVDITIIGEQPKITPHRDAIRTRIANLLALPAQRVNIKATTTEKLGFEGRGEGVACHAMAQVRLPVQPLLETSND